MGRVTLTEVAEHAGVSRATASLVRRGTGRLSDTTRQRVLASMDELGYIYHRGAGSLRTKRSYTVGILVTDISNPSFTKLTLEIEAGLSKAGYVTTLSDTLDDGDRELALVRSFLEYPVDALVRVPAATEHPMTRELLAATEIPVLAVTRQPFDSHSYLGPRNEHGGQIAVQHLARVHGCRRIAYVGGPKFGAARHDRLAGAGEALAEFPDGSLVLDIAGDTSIEGARQLARDLLASDTPFDGVVCHSDLVAYAVLSAWRKAGRPAPLPVVGFDNIPTSEFFDPAVTSIAVDRLGDRAAARVLELLAGDAASTQLIAPSLVLRESCGCQEQPT